jgi:hypothetical protein
MTEAHLGLLDDMDHEAKYDTDTEYRKSELRIQALGAAISRRDWHAVEQAHAAIRDKFYSHSLPARAQAKRWDDWVRTCGKPTVWCGFDWPVMPESYVVFPQHDALTVEQCAQEAQSYITLNTGDLTLAKLGADAIRALKVTAAHWSPSHEPG